MADFLLSIVGLAAVGGAIYEFVKFAQGGLWKWDGLSAVVLAVVFCACALMLFLRHVNKEEEIHITQ